MSYIQYTPLFTDSKINGDRPLFSFSLTVICNDREMPRQPRNDTGNRIYHVINRANARLKIFESDSDYELFENLLMKALSRFSIKLYAYTNMPNHFHLVLYSEKPAEVSKFMHWLSGAFTQHWHTRHATMGSGHLFQGRYKSFPIQNGNHLLQVLLYVERNAVRAKLVKRAEEWRWCSAWIRKYGNEKQKKMLSEWPIDVPKDYLNVLNKTDDENILKDIRFSITKSVSIGSEGKRPRGRPRKK
ncbi:MAG: hypothetical protein JWM92_507 [Candidatus Nomurabacteria bacterium]|nr:hypothetical protein [Candidatus Nomurabacteria bacterium]